jgi:dUTP pyrophosphatase
MEIKFLDKRLTEFKPSTKLAAGYDLRACIDQAIYIPPGGQEKISTGIAVDMSSDFSRKVEDDYVIEHETLTIDSKANPWSTARLNIVPCAIIMPRSGLGCKGVKPRNTPGLIDADYQGEVIVCLYNEGNESVHIQPMDRIAQLVFTLAIHPVMQQVQEFSNATERGVNGFGSTGKQ